MTRFLPRSNRGALDGDLDGVVAGTKGELQPGVTVIVGRYGCMTLLADAALSVYGETFVAAGV